MLEHVYLFIQRFLNIKIPAASTMVAPQPQSTRRVGKGLAGWSEGIFQGGSAVARTTRYSQPILILILILILIIIIIMIRRPLVECVRTS